MGSNNALLLQTQRRWWTTSIVCSGQELAYSTHSEDVYGGVTGIDECEANERSPSDISRDAKKQNDTNKNHIQHDDDRFCKHW